MMNEDERLIVSIESKRDGVKTTVELPNSEDIDEIFNAFYTCLIGMTWQPKTIAERMYEYGETLCKVAGVDIDREISSENSDDYEE